MYFDEEALLYCPDINTTQRIHPPTIPYGEISPSPAHVAANVKLVLTQNITFTIMK